MELYIHKNPIKQIMNEKLVALTEALLEPALEKMALIPIG